MELRFCNSNQLLGDGAAGPTALYKQGFWQHKGIRGAGLRPGECGIWGTKGKGAPALSVTYPRVPRAAFPLWVCRCKAALTPGASLHSVPQLPLSPHTSSGPERKLLVRGSGAWYAALT